MTWLPIETAPQGYVDGKFNRILFKGYSKSGAFSGFVYVSGWMDSKKVPVHNYRYSLIITHWMPIPEPPVEGGGDVN